MKDADIIIVFAPDPQKYKTVILDQTLPSCQPRGYPGTLNEVYQYFATRLHPGRDPRHRNRKCVMQADWAELCLRNNRLLSDMDKADWEIQYVASYRLSNGLAHEIGLTTLPQLHRLRRQSSPRCRIWKTAGPSHHQFPTIP